MIPPYKNRTAEEIISQEYIDDPGWHIHAALSWIDYAERYHVPVVLHYAAFHLRLGIELLWLKIFAASLGSEFGIDDYTRALKSSTTLYKLIDRFAPNYRKFAEFDQIIQSIDTWVHPPTIIWDIARLRKIHGGCGEYLLHLQGSGETGYRSKNWIAGRTRFLKDSAEWMSGLMTTRGNLVVYHPEGLYPETRLVWESYLKNETDLDGTRIRLKLIRPLMQGR